MAESLAAQRAKLAAWFRTAQEALDRHDWRTAYGAYPRVIMEDEPTPWTPAPLDAQAARFILIGSAGLSAPGQTPFDADDPRGDPSWRAFPVDLDLTTTVIAHDHYDHAAAERDRNCVYPLERLRALAAQGEIGGLTATHLSFMGYQPDWANVMEVVAPALAEQAARQHPDAALLVPV